MKNSRKRTIPAISKEVLHPSLHLSIIMNGHHPSHKVLASTSDEEALICLSSRNGRELHTHPDCNYWYLDPEVETSINTVSGERIVRSDNRGWTMNRSSVHVHYIYHRVGRLKRVSENAMKNSHVILCLSLDHMEWSLLSAIYRQLVLRDGWAMIATLPLVQ